MASRKSKVNDVLLVILHFLMWYLMMGTRDQKIPSQYFDSAGQTTERWLVDLRLGLHLKIYSFFHRQKKKQKSLGLRIIS